MLRIEQGDVLLKGITAARVFRRGRRPVEVEPESNLGAMLAPAMEGGNV
jgi:hypothetical protein